MIIREEAVQNTVSGGQVDNKGTVAVRAEAAGKGRRTVLACVFFLLNLLGESWAVLEGEVGVEGMWTDNLYLNAASQQDFVTTPFGHAEATFRKEFGLRYEIDGYLYSTNNELNALWQRASVWHHGEIEGKVDIEAELGYGGILHGTASKNLDHHQIGGSADFNLRSFANTLIVPGIEGYWRTYPDADTLDSLEAIGNLLVNRSFETRTTLRLNGTLYFRRFLKSVSESVQVGAIDDQVNGVALALAAASEWDNSLGSGPGGPGNRAGSGNGGNRGNMRGPGQQGPPPGTAVQGNLESQSAGQFLVAARLAQALSCRAGMFVEGTYRANFLDPPRFAEGSIPGPDRDFFDDHYGYEGPGGRLQASLLLPLRVRWVLSGLIERRRYVGREALDMEGNPKDPAGEERRDERYEVGIRGEFSRTFDRAFPAGISADAGYVRVWNESNDDWYDTGENRVFASVSLLW